MTTTTMTPYDALGGREVVLRLAGAFYQHMAKYERPLAEVHELDDTGAISERSVERFGRFLVEWLGGPAEYSPREGHPRLRMRHAHLRIESSFRDAWLRCMQAALNEVGAEGEVRAFLDQRFFDVADFLRNHPDINE